MSKTIATAAVVRTAFKDGLFKAPEGVSLASLLGKDGKGETVRGRIHPAFVAALVEAHPTKFVAPEKGAVTPKAVATVEVPRVSPKTGRPIKPVTLTVTEVRALAGKPDSKGRLSKDMLAAAGAAHAAANSKPSRAKAAEVTETE